MACCDRLDATVVIGARPARLYGAIYGLPDRQRMTEEFPDDVPHPYGARKLAGLLRFVNDWLASDPD